MTDFKKREKRVEIFGKDYNEHVEYDSDNDLADDQELADICAYAHKGYLLITTEDVLDYIKDRKIHLWSDFTRCFNIAVDSLKHGRFWTSNNKLRKLMERDDISKYERAAMYRFLISVLKLDYEKE